MLKISRFSLILAFAWAGAGSVAAQEAPAVLPPAMPGVAELPKVSIKNANTPQDPALPTQQKNSAPALPPVVAPPPISEFQKFMQDNTGKVMPLYGAEFFLNAPSTFAPIGNAPVPADYPLGPDDELLVRGWGSIDIDYRAKIDRNGLITIPTVGSISVGGAKAGDVEGIIKNAISRLYKGVTVSVTFGQLRSITVYVVGQANRPGTYTVSNLSTLVTALFASGGPNANGSMRNVQVKRSGKVVATLDLYEFIGKGNKSGDIKLLDGDSIYIPSAVGHIALTGKVNKQAIYELRTGSDTVESLLEFSGGLPVNADPRRAFLERINAGVNQPRSVEQFALDAAGLKKNLRNGDVLNVMSITPDFSNAVVLRGNVDQAIRAPFKQGMRVSDLIPSRDYLITRGSVQRQNSVLRAGAEDQSSRENTDTIASRIGNLIEQVNWDYAVIERINRSDLSVDLIPFNLGKVFSNPAGSDNIVLQPGDTVTIFSQNDVQVPMNKRTIFARVEGEVNTPGVYQMNAGETMQDLLARAGGPTKSAYLFGTSFYREQVRREQEMNLEKAVNRLELQLRSEQSKLSVLDERRQADFISAQQSLDQMRRLKPTGRITLGIDLQERSFNRLPQLKLESGDRLIVPQRPDFVHVFGSVNSEASPLWVPGKQVGDYIKTAGLTVDADVDNVFVMRVDGSVVSRNQSWWNFNGVHGIEVMPGDTIIVPEKFNKDTAWGKFTQGMREWAQIFANFGLGAAAIKVLK